MDTIIYDIVSDIQVFGDRPLAVILSPQTLEQMRKIMLSKSMFVSHQKKIRKASACFQFHH